VPDSDIFRALFDHLVGAGEQLCREFAVLRLITSSYLVGAPKAGRCAQSRRVPVRRTPRWALREQRSARNAGSMPGGPSYVRGLRERLGDLTSALDESLDDRAQGAVLQRQDRN
jgi:hypothetical protein